MKKQLFLLAAILAMASSTPAWAYAFSAVAPSGQTLYYNILILSGSAEVTYQNYTLSSSPSYSNLTGALTIPSSVTYNGTTYTVTSIGSSAFWNCTGLTSVTIPNSVTSIGGGAFAGCSGLTSIIYTGTIAQWCGISFDDGVGYSHSLTIGGSEVTNLVIPNGVTEIKQYAFEYCTGLTSVTIPNSVTSIGYQAFSDCTGLTSVTIPNSVTSIGDHAFWYCTSLTSTIYTGTIAQWCGISFDGEFANPLYYSHSLTIGGSEVTNLVIPNGVTEIKQYAFDCCTGLTSVTIPNSVTSIGNHAFSYCSGLTSTIYTGTIAQWCGISFGNVFANPLYYSHSLTIGGTEITNLVIPNGVTEIKQYAFGGFTGLTSVTIPNSVTSIGHYAFSGCSGLTSVTIPNSVTSISTYAFQNCSGLTSVTIGNSVTSIGWSAFEGCSGLTSVTIPNSVTTIGDGAFFNCSGLTSVTIGSGVTAIGFCAFYGCTGLRNIISKAVYPPTASNYTFENVPPSCKLTVPCGSLQVYQSTPPWNTKFPLMEENCNPDGIDDAEIGDVMVYAANGMIYISSTLPTETTIFDITGHQVATFTAEAASIPLPAGVYLVKIGAYPARKVVVIR